MNKNQKSADLGGKYIEPFTFSVYGRPAPQGSKRHVGNGVMVESSKHVKPWRKQIKATASRLLPPGWHATMPMQLEAEFLFKRPKNHYRANGELKPNAPTHCTTRVGDIEKLVRAVADALTGVAYLDDSQIVNLKSIRRYARKHEPESANFKLTPIPDSFN